MTFIIHLRVCIVVIPFLLAIMLARQTNPVSHSVLMFPAHFKMVGISFTRADTQTRSRFAISPNHISAIYEAAYKLGISNFLILSTCNRVEFYAYEAGNLTEQLMIEQLQISRHHWNTYFTTLRDLEAIRHFFTVVSGLDSQVIGDYEIIGQVKSALAHARRHKTVGTVLDRVANIAFQASKKIKINTNLSHGGYSVSHATCELLLRHQFTSGDCVLLIGTGNFGATVAKKLRQYFPTVELTLTNRTAEKAEALATQLNCKVLPFDQFRTVMNDFDVLITTAGSDYFLIHSHDITRNGCKLYFDLSIPQCIEPAVKKMGGIKVYSVDDVSDFHNRILKRRHLEIPQAQQIIDEYMVHLLGWQHIYQSRDVISHYKAKVHDLLSDQRDSLHYAKSETIEKAFSGLLKQIRTDGFVGCKVIEAMNNLVTTGQ